jgi:uncharacterized C2H2 Zn-finger protein
MVLLKCPICNHLFNGRFKLESHLYYNENKGKEYLDKNNRIKNIN